MENNGPRTTNDEQKDERLRVRVRFRFSHFVLFLLLIYDIVGDNKYKCNNKNGSEKKRKEIQ